MVFGVQGLGVEGVGVLFEREEKGGVVEDVRRVGDMYNFWEDDWRGGVWDVGIETMGRSGRCV